MTSFRAHQYDAAERPLVHDRGSASADSGTARCDGRWDELRCDLAIGHQSTHQARKDGTLHSWKDHIPAMFANRLPPRSKQSHDGDASRQPDKPGRTPVAA
jgi:hypothetical protein